jgi:hypothetical protein
MNVQTLLNQELTISPDNVNHKNLEERVIEYLNKNSYVTCSATYHEVMPVNIKNILTQRFSFTSLYLRGRADRIAIHTDKEIEFEWECKTHLNSQYEDLTIEIIPLLHHILKKRMGVRCMYIFEINGFEGGFWVDELPPFRCAWIPPREVYKFIREQLKAIIKKLYPDLRVVESPVRGSGDPFFIIDKLEVKKCKDWRMLIKEL